MLDEIAYYLSTKSLGTIGVDLFKSFMPNNPFTVTTIYEYSGARNQFTFGTTTNPVWERPRLQVVSRSSSYERARKTIEPIYRTLEIVANQTIKPSSIGTGTFYIRIQPIQAPFSMGLDAHELLRIACNFDVMKAIST